jgi:hypothetical protein
MLVVVVGVVLVGLTNFSINHHRTRCRNWELGCTWYLVKMGGIHKVV